MTISGSAISWPGGLGSAAGALRALERRQELIANNLANTDTDGFKAQRAFSRLIADVNATPVPATEAATDFRPGTIHETGRALDVAMEHEGFLVTSTPQGERYVRGGALHLDAQRRLATADGSPVLGEKGPVVLPPYSADISIQPDGLVLAGGVPVDRLRVESLDAKSPPAPEGNGRWVPGASRRSVPAADRSIRGGALEASNAEPVSTMVEMLDVQRSYSLVERAIRALDEAHETAATRIAKPL